MRKFVLEIEDEDYSVLEKIVKKEGMEGLVKMIRGRVIRIWLLLEKLGV